jgi:N-acetylmuramoyl-L-alanine amidase CwlA
MKPEGITVHNTANKASAANEIAYMISNNNQVSYHYAVDDKEIIQGLPENRNGWHAGDGNGDGNRKTIGIEICYSTGSKAKFEKAQENAAEFIAQKLKEYGWGVEKVYPHKHWSGKHCPHRTLDEYGWDYFITLVKKYMAPKEVYRVRKTWADSKS